MSVNKFGEALARDSAEVIERRTRDFRGYVRENALCRSQDGNVYDAGNRRIQQVSLPLNDRDAVNRQHVDGRLSSLSEAQKRNHQEFSEAIVALRADLVGRSLSEAERTSAIASSVEAQEKKITTIDTRLNELSATVGELRSSTAERLEKLYRDVGILEGSVGQHWSETKEWMSKTSGDIERLTKSLSGAAHNFQALDKRINYFAENVVKARTEKRTHTQKLENEVRKSGSRDERVKNLEATVARDRTDIVGIRRDIGTITRARLTLVSGKKEENEDEVLVEEQKRLKKEKADEVLVEEEKKNLEVIHEPE